MTVTDGQKRSETVEDRSEPGVMASAVTATLKAFHLDAHMAEGWHRHTFKVTIWRDGATWTDGRSPRSALKTLLHSLAPKNELGARILPPELWSNEAIARAVAVLCNVTRVEVRRRGFRAELRL